jgi:hypothetical protein
MIVGSVLLVIVAGVLLGLGLVRLDEPLLYSSIGVSALAAFTLVVGVRRLAAVRAGRGTITVRPVVTTAPARPRPVGRAAPRPIGRATVSPAPPVEGAAPVDLDVLSAADPAVPTDEPAPESVLEPDLARAARLDAEVIVVDGRPRFHLAGCLHLLGLESEPVNIAEAIELEFTPCGLCRPVAALRLLTDVDDDAGPPSD